LLLAACCLLLAVCCLLLAACCLLLAACCLLLAACCLLLAACCLLLAAHPRVRSRHSSPPPSPSQHPARSPLFRRRFLLGVQVNSPASSKQQSAAASSSLQQPSRASAAHLRWPQVNQHVYEAECDCCAGRCLTATLAGRPSSRCRGWVMRPRR